MAKPAQKPVRPRHFFYMLLGVLFIGLKLGNVIAWSWLWVLTPLWFEPFIGSSIACFAIFGLGLAEYAKIKAKQS